MSAQVNATKLHPFLYWGTIVATTTLGTTMADFADCSLGIGYPGGVTIVFGLLIASLAIWLRVEGTVSVASVTAPRVEWSTGAPFSFRRRWARRSAIGWRAPIVAAWGLGTFSNWLWATVCLSESMAALRKGVQRALFQLGRVPRYHQTDNSTAATHRIPDGKKVFFEDGKRPFNDDYIALMRHFGMTPRTTAIGAKEQNGDVESENGVIKRRLEQLLLVRGAATSRTLPHGSPSSTKPSVRATPGAERPSAKTSRRCASSTSRGCPSTSRKTSWSANGAPSG